MCIIKRLRDLRGTQDRIGTLAQIREVFLFHTLRRVVYVTVPGVFALSHVQRGHLVRLNHVYPLKALQ